ncbi:polysaccharide biosynthesis protein [Solirubrobacter pauli]|uniref:polysaccharide biosynthesis protein n=1 Tax=Solirubrobacter pauli TaxID=166793 RepID=UPI001FE8B413|nr:nucleoside-diphosphate sugar epimerase/dehydratase [Solirubrobacter pauli]
MALDAGLVALAYYLAFWFRFDGDLPSRYSSLFWRTLTFAIVGSIVCFAVVGMYRHWMRYSSQREYLKIAEGTVIAVLVLVGYVAIVQPVLVVSTDGLRPLSIPAGVLLGYGLLLGALLTGSRFVAHLIFMRGISGWRTRRNGRKVLIIGAGSGGHLLDGELRKNPDLGYRPVGFVDDNKKGPDVFGTTFQLDEVLEDVEPDEVMIAIPSASGELRGRVVRACRERGVPVRTVPTVFELLQNGNRLTRQLREVRVEDVLGRNPVRMEIEAVGNYLRDQRVLVTGAGGSIGAEICRQIARVNPSRIVLVDHSEANLFEIERELVDERHVLTTVSVLADVKDEERMREVFAEHRPDVVFHAAAYKHVGLMESNPIEAVRNNALATRALTTVAGDAGVDTFVLISTDKAVAPATVMGASKALAEWAVEAANARFPETSFCAVRFGNVLGSSGSVVPIFRRQIAAGGPLTVTDPEMTRFFMTIPEAVQLVIRSGSLARGGEVYALDMGEPVAIMELAKQMIEFSGLKVGEDIGIEIIGRRPGEKLHEQLFNSYETPEPTPAERIRRAARPAVDPAWVEYVFDKVGLLVAEGDAAALAVAVAELSTGRTTPAQPSGDAAS